MRNSGTYSLKLSLILMLALAGTMVAPSSAVIGQQPASTDAAAPVDQATSEPAQDAATTSAPSTGQAQPPDVSPPNGIPNVADDNVRDNDALTNEPGAESMDNEVPSREAHCRPERLRNRLPSRWSANRRDDGVLLTRVGAFSREPNFARSLHAADPGGQLSLRERGRCPITAGSSAWFSACWPRRY